MKVFLLVGTIAALTLLQEKPINSTCPVKGTPAKANITVEYKGKTIGFC